MLLGGKGMHEEAIGVLLPKRDWARLNHLKEENNWAIYQYVYAGEKLNCEIFFMTLDKINTKEMKADVAIVKENKVIKRSKFNLPSIIYSPSKYHKKVNIRKLRDLSRNPNVHVINEHHLIKKRDFLNIVSSHPDLEPVVDQESENTDECHSILMVCQKNEYQDWSIPIVYVKDQSGANYHFSEMSSLTLYNGVNSEALLESIYETGQKILKLIQHYYPGMYEVGIQFRLQEDGGVFLRSTYSICSIIKDLYEWDRETCESILEWPIKVANNFRNQNNKKIELENSYPINDDPSLTMSEIGNFIDRGQLLEETNLWVKLNTFYDEETIIRLPKKIMGFSHVIDTTFQFGVKVQNCKCKADTRNIFYYETSYEAPIEIDISSSLAKKMHIAEDLIYQLRITDGKLSLGPTIGFVLGEKNQIYNLDYMEKFNDRFGEYDRFGGLVIAFSSRSVDIENKVAYGMIYNPKEKSWVYGSAPIPAALYRRNFHQNQESIEELKQLTDNNFFNSYYFNKSDLYLLQDNPSISKYLPQTRLLHDDDDLIRFAKEKQKIILKPISLSRGRGILILEFDKQSGGYCIFDYRGKYRVRHLLQDDNSLKEWLLNLDLHKHDYLYQTYISLLKVDDQPLDIRIVMQKDDWRSWKCSGIECRVAGENEDITNIARGGKAMTLEEVVHKSGLSISYSKVYKKIMKVCNNFCKVMDETTEHFAEFGVDIALDKDGFPWLLEANIYPSFKGFKQMDYETYLQIRYQPLYYGVKLQGFRVERKGAAHHEIYHTANPY